MKLVIGLLAILSVVTVSSFSWRHSVKAIFIVLVLEGALRKWVLPQASDLIYFLKDLILLGAYIKYYAFSPSENKLSIKSSPVVNVLILMVTGWCLFQAFNPSLGSPIVGFFGIRGYLFYIPLIWMIPRLFHSEEELYSCLRWYLLLVIPVGFLGIAQFFSPPSSPINVYAPGELSNIATFGVGGANIPRVTGTFSYLAGYGVYLVVCLGLLLPFLSINQSRWWRWISTLEVVLIAVNALMTGSRTVVIGSAAFLLSYVAIKSLIHPASLLRWLRQFLIPIIICFAVASIWFMPAVDAFFLRTTSNSDFGRRLWLSVSEPLEFSQYRDLDGYGSGATHPATRTLRKMLNLPRAEVIPTYYEQEPGRVALELGPIGFLLWYGLRVSIAIELLMVFSRLKSPFLRELALSAFLVHVIQMRSHLVFQHTFLAYYWFLSSLIFLLPRLELMDSLQSKIQSQYLQAFLGNNFKDGLSD